VHRRTDVDPARADAGASIRRVGVRGAALIEYALALSLFVFVSIGALEMLEDSTREEVANEFDCVSERPPPPSCQLRAVTTTTSTTTTTTTTTEVPVDTTTSSVPTGDPDPSTVAVVQWEPIRPLQFDRGSLNGPILLLEYGGEPDRTLSYDVRERDGTVVGRGSCDTFSFFGLVVCQVRVSVPPDAGDMQVVITSISGSPPLAPPADGSPWVERD